MIKNSSKQTGSAHVIVIVILIIALLGTLGFIFWQNFINKESVATDTNNVTPAVEETPKQSDSVVLKEGSFNGSTGTFQARGYLYVKAISNDQCDVNCESYNRAFFHISETPNNNVSAFIKVQQGNAFVEESAIALGCVINGKIQAVGQPMGTPSGDKVYSTELSKLLLGSNESSLVSVEIERSLEPVGSGAPVCYSHFDSIKAL